MTRLLLSVVALALIYSAFLLSAELWDLAAGAGLAVGTVLLFRRHLFGEKARPLARPAQRLLALLRFAWAIHVEIIEGLSLVLQVVLGARQRTRSGIVGIPIGERTESGVIVTAWALTLSPGSVLIDVDWERQVMYFHFMDASRPDELRRKIAVFYEEYQRPVFP